MYLGEGTLLWNDRKGTTLDIIAPLAIQSGPLYFGNGLKAASRGPATTSGPPLGAALLLEDRSDKPGPTRVRIRLHQERGLRRTGRSSGVVTGRPS